MIPHVVLHNYVLRTNEKGWRTRIRHQTPILPCSGVVIPLVKLQVWSFHKWYRPCSGVVIPLVKLQVWSFHKWYRYTTARQYRGLMTNSGTPSFFIGTQDIRI